MRRLTLALVLLLGLAAAARATPATDLGGLMAQHPDDPHLAWAHARALLEEERFGEAAEQLASLRARWPGRFEDAPYLHGLALLRANELELAHAVVQKALEAKPDDDALRLLNAAILVRLERGEEARLQLEQLAEQEPDFAEMADQLSHALVRESADPRRGGTASPEHGERRLRFEAYGGAEFDTNANLDNDAVPGPQESDWRIASGASLWWRVLRGEKLRLDLGARYDREDAVELSDLSRQRLRIDASGLFLLSERTALALDADAYATTLDREWYRYGWRMRPAFLLALGPRAGLLRLFAEGGQTRFEEEPILDSLERDAIVYGGGIEHVLPLAFWRLEGREGWLSLRLGYERYDTEATTDRFGFDGAFDHQRGGGRLRLRGPLPLGFTLDGTVALEGAWFDNDNVIEAVAAARRVARRDTILWSRLSLIRQITRFAQVELTWRHFDRASNVGTYDVRSDVVGAYVTLIPW